MAAERPEVIGAEAVRRPQVPGAHAIKAEARQAVVAGCRCQAGSLCIQLQQEGTAAGSAHPETEQACFSVTLSYAAHIPD